jgi:hypothetical protein
MIRFTEIDHSYVDTESGLQLTSMTTFISKFKSPVDWAEKAHAYVAKRNPKKVIQDLAIKQKKSIQEIEEMIAGREINGELILEIWDKNKNRASSEGTAEHLVRENKWKALQDAGKPVFTNMGVNGVKYSIDLSNLKPGVYPEAIIYHPSCGIVGQSDDLRIFPDKILDINDYKTNDKIEMTSFYNYRTGHQMMLDPISHLHDCNGIHYALQLSGYAYLMELWGYKPRNLTIEHTKDNNKKIKVPYLRDEIIAMLNYKPEEPFNLYNFI